MQFYNLELLTFTHRLHRPRVKIQILILQVPISVRCMWQDPFS